MRNQWYGDHRDLVKWGALVELASKHELRSILYVAYLRPDKDVPLIESELGKVEIEAKVLRHFRNVHLVTALMASVSLEIKIFDWQFEARIREEYISQVVEFVRANDREPLIIFLDPDTGISNNRASSAHVTPKDVTSIWSNMQPKDWMVLYQHASREIGWIEKRRTAFQDACKGGRVLQFCSPNSARDVVLFAASRSNPAL